MIVVQVHVIGSASELGKWKPHDGLKLRYAGDSTWKAECVLRKYEFPLKYPFFPFFLEILMITFELFFLTDGFHVIYCLFLGELSVLSLIIVTHISIAMFTK